MREVCNCACIKAYSSKNIHHTKYNCIRVIILLCYTIMYFFSALFFPFYDDLQHSEHQYLYTVIFTWCIIYHRKQSGNMYVDNCQCTSYIFTYSPFSCSIIITIHTCRYYVIIISRSYIHILHK